jgi:hypothetical protein
MTRKRKCPPHIVSEIIAYNVKEKARIAYKSNPTPANEKRWAWAQLNYYSIINKTK